MDRAGGEDGEADGGGGDGEADGGGCECDTEGGGCDGEAEGGGGDPEPPSPEPASSPSPGGGGGDGCGCAVAPGNAGASSSSSGRRTPPRCPDATLLNSTLSSNASSLDAQTVLERGGGGDGEGSVGEYSFKRSSACPSAVQPLETESRTIDSAIRVAHTSAGRAGRSQSRWLLPTWPARSSSPFSSSARSEEEALPQSQSAQSLEVEKVVEKGSAAWRVAFAIRVARIAAGHACAAPRSGENSLHLLSLQSRPASPDSLVAHVQTFMTEQVLCGPPGPSRL
mmetsp:Transcript_33940/g.108316  ORF Transcript_33940/g.108316 Transcript_33940/m.108316 type:complete len:282 (-) Transcript_33940:255-1100(-)